MPTTLNISWLQWALGVLVLAFLNGAGNIIAASVLKKSRYGFWRNTRRVINFISRSLNESSKNEETARKEQIQGA